MARRYRLGVIGFAHMHVNELVDRFLATGRVDLVACADTVPHSPSLTTVEGSRRANLARALARRGQPEDPTKPGNPRAYADYRAMIAAENLDIAIFCPEIARHAEIAEALAEAGVHMVTEKPMAASLADARRMAEAAAAHGVSLAVNWPITWRPALRKAKDLLAAGAIGDVWELKWRNAASLGPLAHGSLHPGNTVIGLVSEAEKSAEWWHRESDGGGALLDYCCYGACLAAWLLDAPPSTVQAMRANLMSPGDADDNAVLLLRYPQAFAIIEASWTTIHNGMPNGPVLYGTHGTMVIDGADILIYRTKGGGPDETIRGEDLPPDEASIGAAFLRHLETGAPLHPTLAPPMNLAATAILDAGIRAAASGQHVPVEP